MRICGPGKHADSNHSITHCAARDAVRYNSMWHNEGALVMPTTGGSMFRRLDGGAVGLTRHTMNHEGR
jgi:hypothetical protein